MFYRAAMGDHVEVLEYLLENVTNIFAFIIILLLIIIRDLILMHEIIQNELHFLLPL